RLVDEQRLARLDHWDGFLQMNPSVHTFEQHHVHLFQQLRNRIQNLDAHPAQLFGEPFDPVAAGRDICPAGITSHDSDACDIARRFRVIEDFREGGDVRGVQADHPGPERRWIRGTSINPEGQAESGEHRRKPKVSPGRTRKMVHVFDTVLDELPLECNSRGWATGRAHLDTTPSRKPTLPLPVRHERGEGWGGGTFHRIGAANWIPLSLTISPLLRRGERESTSDMVSRYARVGLNVP